MGANVAKQTLESETKLTNQYFNTAISEVNNSSQNTISLNQSINITASELICGTINIQQKAGGKLMIAAQNSTEVASNLGNKINNNLKEELANMVTQEISGLPIGTINNSDLSSLSKTHIENNINNYVEDVIKNSFQASSEGKQEISINVQKLGCESLNLSQDMVLELVSENILNNIVSKTVENVSTTEVAKTMKNEAQQKIVGLNLTFGLSSLGLIIGIIIVAFFIYKQSAAKKEEKIRDDYIKIYLIVIVTLILILATIAVLYNVYYKPRVDKDPN